MVMEQIIKYINENLAEVITLKELADQAGYSEYYFSRKFKDYTGDTVKDYVIKRRLIKASEDIIAGSKIIDAAFEYGWQSHGGFTKAFTKEFGFSPSLLRAMLMELDGLGGISMGHVFLESTVVGTSKERLYDILVSVLNDSKIVYDDNELESAYQLACKAYEGINRYSGEEYVTHTINVAIILPQLEADIEVIIAGLFCDVTNKGILSIDDLSGKLRESTIKLIKKASSNNLKEDDDVLLIKMAERLHNLRTVEYMDEVKKTEKISQTVAEYMPIARKLGIKKLVDELDNLTQKNYNE